MSISSDFLFFYYCVYFCIAQKFSPYGWVHSITWQLPWGCTWGLEGKVGAHVPRSNDSNAVVTVSNRAT